MRNLSHALIVMLVLAAAPMAASAAFYFGVSVNLAPPPLPVYVQPPCPAPGYIWMPGYWAWDDESGYYWVPGTWAMAPAVGLLWTPGYWGWADGAYLWHAGYWGPHVGFYGGINYGFGYTGVGYEGGYWRGSEFYYNRSVTNINTTYVTNVYSRTVVSNANMSRVSFNGGEGGIMARPTSADISAQRERHLGMTPFQRQQEQLARTNPALRAEPNGGHRAIVTAPKSAPFEGHAVAAAREGRPASQFQARQQPVYQAPHEPVYQPRHDPLYPSRAPQVSGGGVSHPGPIYQRSERPPPVYQAPARPSPIYQAPARPSPIYRTASHPRQGPRPEHSGAPERPGERNRHG